jgi:molecular chaperone HscB
MLGRFLRGVERHNQEYRWIRRLNRCFVSVRSGRTDTCGRDDDLDGCGARTDDRFFCVDCGVLLPPLSDQNAFEVFDLPLRFDLDVKSLERSYKKMQMKLHPDLYHTKGKPYMEFAEAQSSLVNDSFNLLLSPYDRSKLILSHHGYDLGESTSTFTDPELLMEIMEIREALEECPLDGEERSKIDRDNQIQINSVLQDLGAAFSSENYDDAHSLTIKLRYLNRIRNEIHGLVDDIV